VAVQGENKAKKLKFQCHSLPIQPSISIHQSCSGSMKPYQIELRDHIKLRCIISRNRIRCILWKGILRMLFLQCFLTSNHSFLIILGKTHGPGPRPSLIFNIAKLSPKIHVKYLVYHLCLVRFQLEILVKPFQLRWCIMVYNHNIINIPQAISIILITIVVNFRFHLEIRFSQACHIPIN